jgi:hypothetical protein
VKNLRTKTHRHFQVARGRASKRSPVQRLLVPLLAQVLQDDVLQVPEEHRWRWPVERAGTEPRQIIRNLHCVISGFGILVPRFPLSWLVVTRLTFALNRREKRGEADCTLFFREGRHVTTSAGGGGGSASREWLERFVGSARG